MTPPIVRRALWLIGLPFVGGAALRTWAGENILYTLLGLVAPGLLLYGIAVGRNWARLAFGFMFVVGLPWVIVLSIQRAAAVPPLSIAVGVVLGTLEGAGVVCLFLPQAAAWYHGRPAA